MIEHVDDDQFTKNFEPKKNGWTPVSYRWFEFDEGLDDLQRMQYIGSHFGIICRKKPKKKSFEDFMKGLHCSHTSFDELARVYYELYYDEELPDDEYEEECG